MRFISILTRSYRKFVWLLSAPIFLEEYFARDTGKEYGISFPQKLLCLIRMIRNNRRIPTASSALEHVLMAIRIMLVPKSIPGVVVECGSYKGASTTNLSLICALLGRRLTVFDSFAGLPEPSKQDMRHVLIDKQQIATYSRGDYRGELEEVKGNIRRFGSIDVCEFRVGYFDETLDDFKEPIVFAFLDVDLRDSLETCVKNIWPLLEDGAYLYVHEAPHAEIASLFFSDDWWDRNLSTSPPGLVGAGSGIGLFISEGGFWRSALGWTVKKTRPR